MIKILSRHREEFWNWCMENHIACEYMGTDGGTSGVFSITSLDTWYIGNEQDRMMAILRWA